MYRYIFVFIALVALVQATTQREDLADWLKENSEIFVILKHWNELPLVSTAWKRLKDTPAVVKSRNSIKSAFETLFDFCDCKKSISRSEQQTPPTPPLSNECSSQNCTNVIPLKPSEKKEIYFQPLVTDKGNNTTLLDERVNKLEAVVQQLNHTFQDSYKVKGSVKTSQDDSETSQKTTNFSASDWRTFVDDHKEEQRWIRSQLIPLNYLFEKFNSIEDNVKEMQFLVKSQTNYANVSFGNSTEQLPLTISNEAFSLLNTKFEYANSLGKNLLAELRIINETVKLLGEDHNSIKKELRNLTIKVENIEMKSISTNEDEEYCPDKLDDMTPCAEVGDSCYCFSKHQKNWTSAAEYCQNKSMYLLSLETLKETELVTKYITQSDLPKDFYWTSGSDEAKEGSWLWTSSQSNVTYTNWRSQQPDGASKENCLYLHGRDEFKWGDWLCSLPQLFICEW